MGRLIEAQPEQPLPQSLRLKVGDLLSFAATGGHVQAGADAVEILGPFIPGTIVAGGQILSPAGAPCALFFLARRPGRARIDVVTGDPWAAPQATTLELTIEGV